MVKATDEDEPREERLHELVRIEAKVSEAAQAAADAAAHAVEATKAAEAASVARAKKKAKDAKAAKAAKAAQKSKAAKSKAAQAARKAAAASETVPNVPVPQERTTGTSQGPSHVVELPLTTAELEQIEQLAAAKGVAVPALARSLVIRELGKSDRNRRR